MKDDIYGTFKSHSASSQAMKTKLPTKLQVTDPRPTGVGDDRPGGYKKSQQGECFFCGHPLVWQSNTKYDGSVIGYCNKLCRKNHENQLLSEGSLVISRPDSGPLLSSGESNTNWAQGWWENITTEPIYIKDKAHLREVCDKHNVAAKALLKPKSQGHGYEMT